MQDALSRMGLYAVHGTDHAAVLMHGKHFVGLVPRCAHHASNVLLKGIDELRRRVKHGLQVILARMLHMKARGAGTGHLEFGGERRTDVVRRNLVAMTGHRQDAHRGGSSRLGARNSLRRGPQMGILGRARIDDDAARRDRYHGLQRKLTLAHANIRSVHLAFGSLFHGMSFPMRFICYQFRLYTCYIYVPLKKCSLLSRCV